MWDIQIRNKLKEKSVAVLHDGGILLKWFVFTCVYLDVTANQYIVRLTDHLYAMMKHFYPDE